MRIIRNRKSNRVSHRLGRLALVLLALIISLGSATVAVAAPAQALTCQQTLQQPDPFGYINFYHGTSLAAAQAIAANGIDLSKSSPYTDFGRGFYVTTNLTQAVEWAFKQHWKDHPTIVDYSIPIGDLSPGGLCGQVFPSATSAYLNFVRSERTNQPPIGGGGYDFVEGPLLLNPTDFLAGKAAITGGQQDSIHTAAAVWIFNSYFNNYYQLSPSGDFPITLRSDANGNYVSAELGYTGGNYAMLRARAASQGPWENYTAYYIPTSNGNEIAIRSNANNNYVSAELGYTGNNYAMLRARASAVGPWEKYYEIENSDGTFSLKSAANGNYVSAELGYTGSTYAMLRARASAIGPWETFTDNSWATNCASCE